MSEARTSQSSRPIENFVRTRDQNLRATAMVEIARRTTLHVMMRMPPEVRGSAVGVTILVKGVHLASLKVGGQTQRGQDSLSGVLARHMNSCFKTMTE